MASNNGLLPRAIFSPTASCVSIWGGSGINEGECDPQQMLQPTENQLTQGQNANVRYEKQMAVIAPYTKMACHFYFSFHFSDFNHDFKP